MHRLMLGEFEAMVMPVVKTRPVIQAMANNQKMDARSQRPSLGLGQVETFGANALHHGFKARVVAQ